MTASMCLQFFQKSRFTAGVIAADNLDGAARGTQQMTDKK